MYSQEIEVDFFPHAFRCVCGRPLLVKASEQGKVINCGGCRLAHMPFRLKKRETLVATPNKLPVSDDQTGKSATLAGDSDVTLVFQTSPSITRWMKRLVILVITAALTYAVYPWIIREPKVYGIGGLRGRLNDMFELIEWDENRILTTMNIILVVIMG